MTETKTEVQDLSTAPFKCRVRFIETVATTIGAFSKGKRAIIDSNLAFDWEAIKYLVVESFKSPDEDWDEREANAVQNMIAAKAPGHDILIDKRKIKKGN
jgi:hypothetical protein